MQGWWLRLDHHGILDGRIWVDLIPDASCHRLAYELLVPEIPIRRTVEHCLVFGSGHRDGFVFFFLGLSSHSLINLMIRRVMQNKAAAVLLSVRFNGQYHCDAIEELMGKRWMELMA